LEERIEIEKHRDRQWSTRQIARTEIQPCAPAEASPLQYRPSGPNGAAKLGRQSLTRPTGEVRS